jgi:hypothetical protein
LLGAALENFPLEKKLFLVPRRYTTKIVCASRADWAFSQGSKGIIKFLHISFEDQRKHDILRFYLGRFEQQVIINFTYRSSKLSLSSMEKHG